MNGDDVRMIERGYCARLLTETLDALGVFGETRRQQLERHLPFQPRVARQIDLTHSSAPDLTYHLIMANRLPGAQFFQGQPVGGDFRGWGFDETPGALVESDQRFNLTAQLIAAAAGFDKKSLALRRPSIQRFLQQLIYLFPTFRRHKTCGEWGVGSGEWGMGGKRRTIMDCRRIFPIPIPHSPLPTLLSSPSSARPSPCSNRESRSGSRRRAPPPSLQG